MNESRDVDGRIRFVEVEGVRIRTAVRGDGRPLLLIMGIGGNIEMWDPLERALEGSDVQTLAFDAPGTGESGSLPHPRRMRGLARVVENLIVSLGFEQLDVLGVSFGGVLAQQLVRDAPHRVRRLVLAATIPGVPGLGGIPGNLRALMALATPRRYYSEEYFHEVAPTLYGGQIRDVPDLERQQADARLRRPPSPRGYWAQLYAIQGWTMLPWLHSFKQRTLVLAGDQDPIVPPGNARILARLIPRARLKLIRGGGHLFLLEHATECAELITAFLAEPDDRR